MAIAISLLSATTVASAAISNVGVLALSTKADRSGAVSLSGAKLRSNVYIFVNKDDVTKVSFYLDSATTAAPYSVESVAPFDLATTASDGSARPLDTTKLTKGSHKLTAVVTTTANRVRSYSVSFSVDNSASSTTTTTAKPTTSTTTAKSTTTTITKPTTSTTVVSGTTRDPLKQPFSSTSIWNMPIGSGATYVPANLPSVPGGDVWSPMPQIDNDIIVLKPTAPLTNIQHSSAAWSGANRCTGDSQTLAQVPIPSGFLIANSRDNNSAAILMQDGRTVMQTQPFARCTTGSAATSLLTFPNVDIYGDGISGSHGGSRMSALGGTIRLGELRPGQQGPRHALKVNVNSPHDLYNCTTFTDCYRWPALTADSGAESNYGTENNNQNKAMKMGALLAIPASVDIKSLGLTSEPGRQLAWTLQNYGAYIVDSTGGPAFAIEAESGPDGSVRDQFQSDYGYPLEQRVRDNTPWSSDLQKIVAKLAVVDNNSASSVGGGGTPRQPLAASLG